MVTVRERYLVRGAFWERDVTARAFSLQAVDSVHTVLEG
jgi:hypothetical protein